MVFSFGGTVLVAVGTVLSCSCSATDCEVYIDTSGTSITRESQMGPTSWQSRVELEDGLRSCPRSCRGDCGGSATYRLGGYPVLKRGRVQIKRVTRGVDDASRYWG